MDYEQPNPCKPDRDIRPAHLCRSVPASSLHFHRDVHVDVGQIVRPDHAASVFAKYYSVSGLTRSVTLTIGALEMALLVAFILGVAKRWTYGTVLVLHGISTLTAYKHYAAPFEGPNLLFFAAWPMLAACVSLYLLRDYDTLGVVRWAGRKSAGNERRQKAGNDE